MKKLLRKIKSKPKTFFIIIGLVITLLALPAAVLFVQQRQNTQSRAQIAVTWPTEPPAKICGNASVLSGPSAPPAGAVVVPAEDNAEFFTKESYGGAGEGKTYWFEPGIHTLGTQEGGQIIPQNNTTFIGAPGAIIDGQNLNTFAFTQQASNVTIKYLTIQNFGKPPVFNSTLGVWEGGNKNQAVINSSAAANWTIQNNTITRNHGIGLFTGSNAQISYNCIDANGQHGFGGYRPKLPDGSSSITNVTLDHNEISNNNTDDWESKEGVCGCTGGGKFWDTKGGRVTNNWVHDNKSVGLWADVNNIDFLFEGNYINNNDDEGLFYELSYNTVIRNNTFKRNAIKKGQKFASTNDRTPAGAIYVSESGGDSRVSSTITGTANLEINNNYFEDNWDGVSLYEGANRYCGNPKQPETGGEAKSGYCTVVNPDANFTTCNDPAAGGSINIEPYYSDCRHKTQNVSVHHNEFHFNHANLGNCNPNNCGRMALYSDVGTNTPLSSGTSWNPYMGNVIKDAITFNQNNKFSNNNYYGNWKFMAYDSLIEFGGWLAVPYNQDAGSTTDVMSKLNNHLSKDTETLEGSMGNWSETWYGSSATRSTEKAQSGSASMRVQVTSAPNWGVSLDNWPGFAASPGNKTISFWGISGSGNHNVTMRVKWRNASNSDIQEDIIIIPALSSAWQQAKKEVVAPAGTVRVFVELFGENGTVGNVAYLDNFFVGDTPSDTSPTTAPTTPPATTTPPPTVLPTPTALPTPTRVPTPTPVSTDTIQPSVSITSPLNGATVARGKTTVINASASDNVGVARVEFYVNGALVCTDTLASYTCSWAVPGKRNATYTLTARAYDTVGNSRTSTTVTVTAK